MRFRTFLRLFFLVGVLVPVVGLGALITDLRIDRKWDELDAQLTAGMQVAATLYETAQADARDDARRIANDTAVAEAAAAGDLGAVEERLEEILASSSDVTSVAFSGGDESVRVTAPRKNGFAEATATVTTSTGLPIGRIEASTVDAAEFVDSAARMSDVDFLASREGEFVRGTLDTGSFPAPGVPKFKAGANTEFRAQRQTLGFSSGIPEHVAAIVDASDTHDAVARAQLWLFGLVALASVVALLAATVSGRRLANTVRSFIDGARRIADGRFDERLPEEGDDEFSQLGREFNRMTDHVRTRIEDLETKQSELELALAQSVTDDLTGLSNTRELHRAMARELARSKRSGTSFGFILFDLDDFKQINDTYGHREGDRVLIAVGGVLRHLCRSNDVPVRYGGEELAVILPDTDLTGTQAFAARLRSEISQLEMSVEAGKSIGITASFGIVSVPEHPAEDPSAVFAAADRALYRAKDAGKDRIEVAVAPGESSLDS